MCRTITYKFERCQCVYIRGYVDYCARYIHENPTTYAKRQHAKFLTPACTGMDIRLHNIDIVSLDMETRKAPKDLDCRELEEVLTMSPFGAGCPFCDDPEGRRIIYIYSAAQDAENEAKETVRSPR
ncbi:hypothetical protein N7G274_009782 [Stereocaulon virgatum]|uniref:Uncharacterized protein n=1 Tax=Stereocaulon virgatum TaxID=373712 RepID=A0ABR3ZXQ4_9LECA